MKSNYLVLCDQLIKFMVRHTIHMKSTIEILNNYIQMKYAPLYIKEYKTLFSQKKSKIQRRGWQK